MIPRDAKLQVPKDSSHRSAIRHHQSSPESASALEQALRGEGAVSLGKAGRAVERSLAVLRAMPNEHSEYEAYDIPRAVLARGRGRALSAAEKQKRLKA